MVFALSLSVKSDAIPASGTLPISAHVTVGNQSQPLSLTAIGKEILGSGTGNGWGSGSGRFTVSVPDTTHGVDLVITEGSFSQGFDLWTLTRTAPAPVVLYRDATMPTLAATSTTTGALALSNPADGFSDTAKVSVQSAVLGEFPPSGAGTPPSSPDQAVLSVVLDAEYPFDQNDLRGSGHYLGARSPLPGSLLTFIPAGDTAITATMSNAGDNANKGNHDDGLFDATYSFVVPADVTTGTLSVGAGSFSGTEFTLFSAEQGTTTLDIASPLTLALGFPAVSVDPHQPTPPWVGAPLPPTASATATATDGSAGGSFPIWLVVLVLSLLAAGAVLLERRRRQLPLTTAVPSGGETERDSPVQEPPVQEGTNLVKADAERSLVTRNGAELIVVPADVTDAGDATEASATPEPVVNVLGAVEITGLRRRSDRRIVDELLVYLVCHDRRHLRASQIRLRMWPTGSTREEVAEKTLGNYLSELQAGVGVEHLPEAGREGYLLVGVASDWTNFKRLVRQADATGGDRASQLRAEALALVRGRPFEDVVDLYEWVGEEHLDTEMTAAIATCALTLATDRLEAGDNRGAFDAAVAGLRGTGPEVFALWETGARALAAAGERTGLRRWIGDAARHLDPADVARMEESFPLGCDQVSS